MYVSMNTDGLMDASMLEELVANQFKLIDGGDWIIKRIWIAASNSDLTYDDKLELEIFNMDKRDVFVIAINANSKPNFIHFELTEKVNKFRLEYKDMKPISTKTGIGLNRKSILTIPLCSLGDILYEYPDIKDWKYSNMNYTTLVSVYRDDRVKEPTPFLKVTEQSELVVSIGYKFNKHIIPKHLMSALFGSKANEVLDEDWCFYKADRTYSQQLIDKFFAISPKPDNIEVDFLVSDCVGLRDFTFLCITKTTRVSEECDNEVVSKMLYFFPNEEDEEFEDKYSRLYDFINDDRYDFETHITECRGKLIVNEIKYTKSWERGKPDTKINTWSSILYGFDRLKDIEKEIEIYRMLGLKVNKEG